MSAESRDQWRRLAEYDTNPDWFEAQLEKIRQGSSLWDLAKTLEIYPSVYRNWIRGNADRELSYTDAERDRKINRLERVLQATFDTAVDVSKEPVSHSERLRAAEILLKPSTAVSVPEGKEVAGINITFVDAEDGKPR